MYITLCVMTYPPKHRWWAIQQMGLMPRKLRQLPELTFFKWMGTGQGKVFSLKPDFSRYAFLAVWQSESQAKDFFTTAASWQEVQQRASTVRTFALETIRSHGAWNGSNPFQTDSPAEEGTGPIAVITRATLKLRALPAFWRNSYRAAARLEQASGLIYSIGMGEVPYFQQATFSVWESLDAMKAFAYRTADHKEAMRQKEQQQWYGEELFARFVPVPFEPGF
ncbi:DUF3291 domain-containing protein [Siphonobacter curvatus]|uniref:Spheroidene monooxygenase n=1 Tax=Siphonobacter curvatus TaxID=2094562 RepID=A0A2S7IP58_9BACT|nr:DUF3291 domain-containing protein [Siphonobacter curvatus]PQA59456.1 spheroidene monooxygenase [Siphonobacter curvatus]